MCIFVQFLSAFSPKKKKKKKKKNQIWISLQTDIKNNLLAVFSCYFINFMLYKRSLVPFCYLWSSLRTLSISKSWDSINAHWLLGFNILMSVFFGYFPISYQYLSHEIILKCTDPFRQILVFIKFFIFLLSF